MKFRVPDVGDLTDALLTSVEALNTELDWAEKNVAALGARPQDYEPEVASTILSAQCLAVISKQLQVLVILGLHQAGRPIEATLEETA
jgi:hypothetical protein